MYDVFSLPPIRFPESLLWGSATAGHQIEGDNIHSQAWHREQLPEFYKEDPERKIRAPSGKACDHYRLYWEDMDLISSLSHRAYRMSIEWSRIEPLEGQWDQNGVAHYLDLLDRLMHNGIQIFVTLHHFTHPSVRPGGGGFGKTDNRRFFERYLNFLLPKISPYVSGLERDQRVQSVGWAHGGAGDRAPQVQYAAGACLGLPPDHLPHSFMPQPSPFPDRADATRQPCHADAGSFAAAWRHSTRCTLIPDASIP